MDSNYDAIVIGSGLGGLTAGALYAKQGKRVLVLERHLKFGGAATGFKRKGLCIEVGLHEMDGLDEGDIKANLVKDLALKENLEFIPTRSFYEIHHPLLGEGFVMPEGILQATEATIARFPAHESAIRKYFKVIQEIRASTSKYNKSKKNLLWWLLNGPLFPLRYWPIVRYENMTVGRFLSDLFGDDEAIKFALAGNFPYYGEDINKLSLVFYASAQASYHKGGSYFIKGGSQKLSDHLMDIIKNAGGESCKRRSVTRILMNSERAVGVEHEKAMVIAKKNPVKNRDIKQAFAPVIFGNAAPNVIRDMLPMEQRETFYRKHKDKVHSTSLWTIYIGLRKNPVEYGAKHYSTFFYSGWAQSLDDIQQASDLLGGPVSEYKPGFAFVNYSAIDLSMTDEGYYLAEMCGFDKLENWEELSESEYEKHKAMWLQAMIDELDKSFPGISESIVYKEMATAKTVKDYLNTPGGAVYGYAQEPRQSGRNRPHSKTEIDGLFLASAFASPGGGFTGAMCAGEAAVQAVGMDGKQEE